MKFKYLITLPLVALLASCGSQPSEQISERVKQKLPEDVEQVSGSEEKTDLIRSLIEGVTDLHLVGSMFNAQYKAEVKGSGKLMNYSVNESSLIEASVGAGFEKYDETTAGDDLIRGFVGITDLDMQGTLQFPGLKETEDESAAPELELKTIEVNYENISLPMYYIEEEDATNLYINASNTDLQDLVVTVTSMIGVEDIDSMLDLVLGEKGEEEEYRPGKIAVNVTTVMEAVLNGIAGEEEVPAVMLEMAKHPFKYLELYLKDMIAQRLNKGTIAYLASKIAGLNPAVGAKYEEEELSRVSMAWNSLVKDAVKKFGGDTKDMPISGSFGLLVSAGTETGAEQLALQEVQVKADLKGPYESEIGKLNISSKMDLDVTASYGDSAVIPSMPDGELVSSYVECPFLEGMLVSLIGSFITKTNVQ